MISQVRVFLASALLACAAAPALAADPQGLAFFESKVRPVLVERCYECHSVQSGKNKGKLRLDSLASILAGGESGPALVPGEPEKSRLIEAVRYVRDDLEMPPKGKLPEAVTADLTAWVAMGAPWPDEPPPVASPSGESKVDYDRLRREHWSFQPVIALKPPEVKDRDWPLDPVDRFVLAKLEEKGLRPAPPAERRALVRRIYFDLVGLPPTPDDVAAFVNDPASDAFEQLVDRLLDSPDFGERWGRHWLDVARYADSTGGGRSLILNNAWRYRDWVIDSFNRDKPYDRFVMEQIAGDLMPADNVQQAGGQLIATGFLALGPKNLDAQDKDMLRMDVVDEQLDTIGRAVLGLSIGCARCHDHKFDPIPTREYYALAGILRSTQTLTPGNVCGVVERQLPLPDEGTLVEAAREHAEAFAAARDRLAAAKERLVALKPTAAAPRIVADPRSLPGVVVDDAQAKLIGYWKPSVFVNAYVGAGYVHDDNAAKGEKSAEFVPDLPAAGVYEVRLSYAPGNNRAAGIPVTVRHADGDEVRRIDQSGSAPIDGLFVSAGRFRFDRGRGGSVTVRTDGTQGYVIVDAVQFIPVEGLDAAPADAPAPDAAAVAAAEAEVKRLQAELDKIDDAAPTFPKALCVQDEPAVGDYHVCVRGSVHNAGEPVPRGFLSVATAAAAGDVAQLDSRTSGRRELAAWLAHSGNPLTARVMVNRVWHHLFGAGIVRTPDDFGTTGEAPSHPELLDWLADDFQRNGLSVKKTVRRIVLSRSYRMASRVADPAGAATDPENRLLWRANRRRLDAEALRDGMLAIGGKLDRTRGGPTVKEGASEFTYTFEGARRSVYVPVLRYAVYEVFEVFDFPDSNLVVGGRSTSTLATQALFLMNSPFVSEQSRAAAESLLADTPGAATAERVTLAYRRTLCRPPTDAEKELALRYLADTPNDVEAWTRLQQVLFACVDFQYLD